jgi:hypothetical protein
VIHRFPDFSDEAFFLFSLHVAWDDLKRRMPAAGAVPQQTAFVELVTPQVQSVRVVVLS